MDVWHSIPSFYSSFVANLLMRQGGADSLTGSHDLSNSDDRTAAELSDPGHTSTNWSRNEGSAARSHRRCTAIFDETVARASAERGDVDKCWIAKTMAFSNLE
jgi:hypothetical protein